MYDFSGESASCSDFSCALFCFLVKSANSTIRQRAIKIQLKATPPKSVITRFDLDPKASFRITGEQIDGAFAQEGTDFLFEAKWQQELVGASGLDSLAKKLSRKLENTLGLFHSINGFSEEGVKAHASGRRLIILMDGSDLMAVLEERIDLFQLLSRKRRHASRTGNIYLKIHEILVGLK